MVLGDSIATTNGCSGCTGFPDLYGRAIAEAVSPSIAGNAAFVAAQREVAARHGGVWVDMLKRMNGPLGRHAAATHLAADYTHLNQLGQELTARALTQSGWKG